MRIILLATAVYIFSGCGNTEESEDPAKKFIGQWTIKEEKREATLATNSKQIVLDRSLQGTGVIEISGEVIASLKYITHVRTIEGDTSIGVSNLQPYSEDNPKYLLWCSTIGESKHISFGDGYTVYYSGMADFSFDDYTLVINNISLNNDENDSSITINGTLTGMTVNIPANIPTKILKYIVNDPEQTLIFKEDDLFVWTYQDKYASTGIWEATSDTITLYGSLFGELLHFSYLFNDGNLEMYFEDKPCSWFEDNPYEYENCLNYFEEGYNLEVGSLDDIINHITRVLSQTNDGVLNTVEGSENHYYENLSLQRNIIMNGLFYLPEEEKFLNTNNHLFEDKTD
ncbi:MAG: hypothetical protein GWP19_06140 [Planctomycetia bacterium]|nr:hypothetical protein [Planctomycetia bacterium]